MFNCPPNGFVWLRAGAGNFGGEDRSGRPVPSGLESLSSSCKHLGLGKRPQAGALALGFSCKLPPPITAAGTARITEDPRDGRCQVPSAVKLKNSDTAHSLSYGNGGAGWERNGWQESQMGRILDP